jgi:hypothetical protein
VVDKVRRPHEAERHNIAPPQPLERRVRLPGSPVYLRGLRQLEQVPTKDGRRVGDLAVQAISPRAALHEHHAARTDVGHSGNGGHCDPSR